MKKILSVLAFAGLTCSALSGCVDDNPYVMLRGLTLPGACNTTSTDQSYLSFVGCNPTGGVVSVAAQVVNYSTGESPWSGSGGGSGTHFETEIPNKGLIFVDKYILSCKSVDGESSGCKGTEDIEISANAPVSGSGGGACVEIPFSIDDITNWGTGDVTVDVYAKYHDSSNIRGETSHAQLLFKFDPALAECSKTLISEDDAKAEEENKDSEESAD